MREVLHGAVKSIDFGGILTASGPAIADTKLELRNCRSPLRVDGRKQIVNHQAVDNW